MPPSAAELLMEIYRAAVRGADPGVAVREALAASPFSPDRRLWLLAIGKAANTMATAAVAALAEQGITIAGGVVVGAHAEVAPHAELEMATGEHPLPGMQSLKAAERIGTIVTRVRPEDDVLVLLSGGGTSLAGAPIDGVSSDDLLALNVMLLGSGADIMVMNGVRKRFSRWAAGRLARAPSSSELVLTRSPPALKVVVSPSRTHAPTMPPDRTARASDPFEDHRVMPRKKFGRNRKNRCRFCTPEGCPRPAYVDYKEYHKSGADTLFQIARCYEAQNDLANAAKFYNAVTAYEEHPRYWDAKEALKRLGKS